MNRWLVALRLIGIGWYVALSIVLPAVGGLWLDTRLNIRPLFTLVGLGIGIVVAFYGVYRMLRQFQFVEKAQQARDKTNKEQD